MISQDKLRHDIRGRFNGLKLCVSALECSESNAEVLEFISHIEAAAEQVETLMGSIEIVEELPVPSQE